MCQLHRSRESSTEISPSWASWEVERCVEIDNNNEMYSNRHVMTTNATYSSVCQKSMNKKDVDRSLKQTDAELKCAVMTTSPLLLSCRVVSVNHGIGLFTGTISRYVLVYPRMLHNKEHVTIINVINS